MKQILCWNFILPSLALCCCFLDGFCLVRKLPAICVGWLSAILASLLFSFYVCLILFLLALAFSRLQLNVKIQNNYFSIPLVSAENNSSKEICNLWIESQSQKLRGLRGVIEFHMPERLLRTARSEFGFSVLGLTCDDLHGWPHFTPEMWVSCQVRDSPMTTFSFDINCQH